MYAHIVFLVADILCRVEPTVAFYEKNIIMANVIYFRQCV